MRIVPSAGIQEVDLYGYRFKVRPVVNPPQDWGPEMRDKMDYLVSVALSEALPLTNGRIDPKMGFVFNCALPEREVRAAIEQARALVFTHLGIEFVDERAP